MNIEFTDAQFDESLVTGNEMIDSQHKELIGKINDLINSFEAGSEKIKAIKMLEYLAEYTDFHFGEEEKLQEDIEYPGLEEHKKKHQEFRNSIEELHQMLEEEEGPTDRFVEQVNKNVIAWLYGHIKSFDRSIAEFKYMRDSADRL